MSSSPEEKAGNAAAIEEVSYDIGNVLGVALLGSVAAIAYRIGVQDHHVLGQLDKTTASSATESLAGALHVANRIHCAPLADAASKAFTHSFELASGLGGFALIIVGVVVYRILPCAATRFGQHV